MKTKRFLSFLFAFVLVLNLSVFSVSATETPDAMEAAAVTLREGIKNWENLVTVTFTVEAGSFNGTAAAANTLAQQVLDLALAHTGQPDEGDYLRFNIGYMEPTSVNFVKQGDNWQFTVTYYFAYWTSPEQEAELDERIEELVQELDLRNDQLTAYQKVSAIYNYICGNVVYDYENLHDDSYGLKFTTYAAVVNKTAVCQGYATLFYRLCLEAGVDNRIITGEGINSEGQPEDHAWNLVELDGQYYCLDSTWDAGMYDYWCFLKSTNDFYNHTPDPEYLTEEFLAAYPVAAQSYQHPNQENMVDGDYEYRVVNGPFEPNSAYRTVTHNAKKDVGGEERSYHLYGLAVDIPKNEATPQQLYDLFEELLGESCELGIYSWGVNVAVCSHKKRFVG